MKTKSRRRFLVHALSGAIAMQLPDWTFAAVPGESRLVVVLLRGALDGMAAVRAATGRSTIRFAPRCACRADPRDHTARRLLRSAPQLAFCAARWGAGELLPCHAVATPYRDRSHFDGQNVLENGGDRPSASASGWLNRALAAMPRTYKGLALGQNVPLILRGPAPVATWAPSTLRDPDEDLIERLEDLYSGDELLSARLTEATQAVELAADANVATGGRGQRGSDSERLKSNAATAGRILAAADGARVAVMDASGWDTHANQGSAHGQLANRLKSLDGALRALHEGLGPAWRRTIVVVLTEFGRTVAINGTRGTDHGTGTVALLLGGAVAGGRVVADWPGLRPADLFEGRDLKPTISVHALIKGVLRDHLAVSEGALAQVFPAGARDRPVAGLVRG
jgi:uncharacterized protein (DUF1501 family)